ncbi:MAG: ABC transporter ATP-binding protein [Anaerolineae bacterium]|jgi:putative ABC transport system ATP-binding protein|nr:ABC transporter ATP-binding protein [Anaerolineae bacterium]MDX9828619.1 ABC transporter ATP-binding protein [Anaerolineae bacterium]
MAREAQVEMRDVTKTYQMGQVRVHALCGLDLSVREGEFVVIVGPSGSGKTTTLNLIGGLDSPTSGELIVAGTDVAAYDDKTLTAYRRDQIGFIFQFFNLLPTLTASENVEFALELVERNSRTIRPRALALLEKVGLGERADHFPSQLSGGEQQRVAIARALAKDPLILLADEPTGNLDFRMGQKVLRVMQDLNQQEGRTVILVTHNTAIGQMGDRVVHLRDGQVAHVEVHEQPLDAGQIEW